MKKLIALLLTASALLVLASCGYSPKPVDGRTVITLSGEKVKYDYFRYVFLNTKNDMDGGDKEYWTKHPEAFETLKETVLDTLVNNRAIALLASEQKLALTKEEKKEIADYLKALKKTDGYSEGLSSSFMTEYSLHYIQSFTELWRKVYDHYVSDESGLIESSDATVLADVPVNFRRIRYVMLSFTDANRDETRERAEDIKESADLGGDFATLVKDYCDDPSMSESAEEGYYYTVGQLIPEMEKAVEKLSASQISEVIEISGAFFIVQRLEIDMEYVKANLEDFVTMYKARVFNELLAEKKKTVKVETTELWDSLELSDVK